MARRKFAKYKTRKVAKKRHVCQNLLRPKSKKHHLMWRTVKSISLLCSELFLDQKIDYHLSKNQIASSPVPLKLGPRSEPIKHLNTGLKDVVKHIKKQEKRLIVVLESANLETVKFGKGYGLLNVDEHSGILKKLGRDFSSARPDITHQCLLMLLDSPLNRAGLLQVHFKVF